MPHASPARRSPSSALLALSLAALLAAPTPAPYVSRAAACPIEPPPAPLRILYGRSERVVVARAGESAPVGGEADEDLRRTAFSVSESLKGDPGEKTLHVYHAIWPENPEAPQNFRRGETLLLFLRRPDDASLSGYEVLDMRVGAKRLSEEALKLYVKRIEELNWLNRQGEPAASELAEWLVRCAEEPATRWEGAYELAVAQRLADGEEEAARKAAGLKTDDEEEEGEEEADAETEAEAAEPTDAAGEAEPVEAAPAEEPAEAEADEPVEVTSEMPTTEEIEALPLNDSLWQGTDVKAEVVRALTPEQKERLASALYGAEKLDEGELELVPVVAAWDGARLTPFLLERLTKLTDDPPYSAEGLIETVASLLKDRQLRKLARKYSEDARYGEYSEDEEVSEDDSSSERADAQASEPRPATAQVRGRMLRAFIAAAEEHLKRSGVETASR